MPVCVFRWFRFRWSMCFWGSSGLRDDRLHHRKNENLLQTTTVQKKSAHMASSQSQLRGPDPLAWIPPTQLRSMGSRHPCRNLRVVPTTRGWRTGQRCKPTECSNNGTMRVSLDRLSWGGSLRDFAFANWLTKCRASSDHLQPISQPSTTKRALPPLGPGQFWMSGLLLVSCCRTAPSWCTAVSSDGRHHSCINCQLCSVEERPSATTSIFLLSILPGGRRSRSATRMLTETQCAEYLQTDHTGTWRVLGLLERAPATQHRESWSSQRLRWPNIATQNGVQWGLCSAVTFLASDLWQHLPTLGRRTPHPEIVLCTLLRLGDCSPQGISLGTRQL